MDASPFLSHRSYARCNSVSICAKAPSRNCVVSFVIRNQAASWVRASAWAISKRKTLEALRVYQDQARFEVPEAHVWHGGNAFSLLLRKAFLRSERVRRPV